MPDAELRAALRPWRDLIPMSELRPHVFISYRWNPADSPIADKLFDILSAKEMGTEPLRVFLDHERLEDGTNFVDDYLSAMLRSHVVCPLVSWSALKRMTVLREDSEPDAVLLEWSLAIELSRRLGTKIQPLFIGSKASRPPTAARRCSTSLPSGRPS